jgi:AcrR family transcriptional regulator
MGSRWGLDGSWYACLAQMYNTFVWNICSVLSYTEGMTNREALLKAAKECLLKKGYARTTARDIASAAGVSLAAIGYHFASKEALLTEALLLAFGEWDKDLQRALQASVPPNVTPTGRYEATWARIIATFESHRSLWIANFEIFAQMVGQPATREVLTSQLQTARTGLAAMFLNQEESAVSDETSRTIGTFHHVLLSGLLMQWLIDPSSALSAKDLTEALRSTAEGLRTGQERDEPKRKRKQVEKMTGL